MDMRVLVTCAINLKYQDIKLVPFNNCADIAKWANGALIDRIGTNIFMMLID